MKQKINMADTIIPAEIAYNFYAIPYSMPAIKKLDRKIRGQSSLGYPKRLSALEFQQM
jgi:hypothetical protein